MLTEPVILVADDNANDVCLLKQALRASGMPHAIEVAQDGRQVIEFLKSRGGSYSDRSRNPLPALLVIDLRLPRVDGFEVLEWIGRQQHLRHLPVVVLSGPGSEEQWTRALDLGALCCLTKPLGYRELAELVRNDLCCLVNGLAAAA